MFKLDAQGITKSRQGYLFAYAQIVFNQVRRHANLTTDREEFAREREHLRGRVQSTNGPPDPNETPLGWRTFTREYELQAEELEIRSLAVVMTALFLEAYIFDYCARRESATFARKYVDQLDPIAKWVLIPRLRMRDLLRRVLWI
jgi:hypothetical protein